MNNEVLEVFFVGNTTMVSCSPGDCSPVQPDNDTCDPFWDRYRPDLFEDYPGDFCNPYFPDSDSD